MPEKARRRRKTIDDVSRHEWGELARASVDILQVMSLMYWENDYESQELANDDHSYSTVMNRLRAALARIGLPQITYHQFEANLELLLRSGKPIGDGGHD